MKKKKLDDRNYSKNCPKTMHSSSCAFDTDPLNLSTGLSLNNVFKTYSQRCDDTIVESLFVW